MFINELKNIKLLYVEDQENIRKNAMAYFNRIFDEVYEASNAFDALKIYNNIKPQIIITDIKMEQISGLDFIKRIRAQDKTCQIIVISAFTDTKFLLDAIELNLVKYLIKPVRPEQMNSVLLQCVENLKGFKSNTVHISSTCSFDCKNKTLKWNNKLIKLSSYELKFLELLCTNKDKTYTYEEIQDYIWQDSFMSENAIRTLVKKLRKKLPSHTLINISKVGYKLQCMK